VNPINTLLVDIATYAYGVAALFGVLFLIQLARTDFYRHPWGRNVAAFMACLAPLELLAFSRRFFGDWPGQIWMVATLSVAIALVQAQRWWLQFIGNRRQRKIKRSERTHHERVQIQAGGVDDIHRRGADGPDDARRDG
jgi:hypothetical protein